MDKKKYEVTIADVEMSIISDEREDFVQRLVSELDTKISAITLQSKRCSKLDAAILVALDYASDKIKSEKRVRNLEAQIALYDANLRRMRDDNIKLKSALLEGRDIPAEELKESGDSQMQLTIGSEDDGDCAEITDESDGDAVTEEEAVQAEKAEAPAGETEKTEDDSDVKVVRDEKIRQIADLFHRAPTEDRPVSDDPEKESKLRQIESLLRKKDN